MNIHPDCQTSVPKCQPKSRLLRRQRSASEIDGGVAGGGVMGSGGRMMADMIDDDSEFSICSFIYFLFVMNE